MQMEYPSLDKLRVGTVMGHDIYALDRDHYGKRAGSLFIMKRAADGSLKNLYYSQWPAELKYAYNEQQKIRGGNVHHCAYKSKCPMTPNGTGPHDWQLWSYPGHYRCENKCGCYFDDY
jgi:hypothetical protein